MNKQETQILRWNDVEPIFRFYLNVWPNDLALSWASVSWQALIESGSVNHSSEKEELRVRSFAVALSLVYYEYCHRSTWHEDPNFRYWTDEVHKSLRNDLGGDTEQIEALLFEATQPLLVRIGDRELAAELWISCVEASRGFIGTTKEKSDIFRAFFGNGNYDPMFSRGCEFVLGELDDLERYESVSGLGIF